METSVFMSGNSQAVRIPRELRLSARRVSIEREGSALVIRERPKTFADVLSRLPMIPDLPDDVDDAAPKPVEAW